MEMDGEIYRNFCEFGYYNNSYCAKSKAPSSFLSRYKSKLQRIQLDSLAAWTSKTDLFSTKTKHDIITDVRFTAHVICYSEFKIRHIVQSCYIPTLNIIYPCPFCNRFVNVYPLLIGE